MSDEDTAAATDGHGSLDGRYCYCLVPVDDEATAGDAVTAEVGGVDGEMPRLVVAETGGVAAVVHACEGPYESDDPRTVKRWLLSHHAVVDRAMERFGTVLPFRFDVVLAGGDDGVRDWLADNATRVREELERLRGRREYRLQLLWDDPESRLLERDEELRELDDARTGDSGRAYLEARRYDQRLKELIAGRRSELAAALADAVDPVVEALVEQDSRSGGALGEGQVPGTGADGEDDEEDVPPGEGDEPFARFAVLAPESEEAALGDALDEVAAEPDVQVRFTGPWAPYSFAPAFGEDDGGASA